MPQGGTDSSGPLRSVNVGSAATRHAGADPRKRRCLPAAALCAAADGDAVRAAAARERTVPALAAADLRLPARSEQPCAYRPQHVRAVHVRAHSRAVLGRQPLRGVLSGERDCSRRHAAGGGGGAAGHAEPVIGASGGVFGVLLAFAWYFPRQRLFVIPIPIPIPAWLFVTLYGGLELFLGVTGRQEGVAHFAHLGGMLGGALCILYWRARHRFS